MIYLVRHGQTELNRSHALQGRSDLPLTPEGERQADEVGAWLRSRGVRFTSVWSSPLIRAVQTARRIASDAVPRLDNRLLEMDYGPYEGMDLRSPPPEILAFFRDFAHQPAPPGMEQLSSVVERLGRFLEELRPTAGEGDVLVTTHAIAMKGALEYLTPDSHGSYWSRNIGNCAVFTFEASSTALTGFTVPVPLPVPTDGS